MCCGTGHGGWVASLCRKWRISRLLIHPHEMGRGKRWRPPSRGGRSLLCNYSFQPNISRRQAMHYRVKCTLVRSTAVTVVHGERPIDLSGVARPIKPECPTRCYTRRTSASAVSWTSYCPQIKSSLAAAFALSRRSDVVDFRHSSRLLNLVDGQDAFAIAMPKISDPQFVVWQRSTWP